MKRAKDMTSMEMTTELRKLEKDWDEFAASDDEGHGGSPGEWLVERMGELETELKRRAALLKAPTKKRRKS